MFVYNITFAISEDLNVREWVEFVKKEYLDLAIKSQYFREYKVLGLLRAEHGDAGTTFACQLQTDTMAKITKFESEEKEKLDQVLKQKFGEKCLSFVTVLAKF